MNHLKEFQKKHGLKADGIIGKATISKMQKVFGITSASQLAHFLANVDHETGGFIADTENLNYSAKALAATWPNRFTTIVDTKDPKTGKTVQTQVINSLAKQLAGNSEAIANNVYGGRMGNTAPGDGWKYRGRGSLQLTGKNNYKLFSMHMNDPEILTNPDIVASKYFWESAIFYFTKENLWVKMRYADSSAVKAVRKGVNGGYIGLKDVQDKFSYYYNLIPKQQ